MESKNSEKIKKTVNFPCPKCGTEISREEKHRRLSIEYKCPKCGFVGP